MRARPDMRAVATDPLDHWFASVNHPPTAASFPGSSSSHQRGWAEVRWGPLVVLHTSGSTGLPKPIVCREGMLAVADAFHDIPDRDGRPIAMRAWAEKSKLMFVPMPLFHAAALFVTVMRSVYWGAPVALSLSDRPLTADVALACIAHSGADAVILPPVILEEMSHSPEQTRALSRLNFVLFGGGAWSLLLGL
ncbi:hypothetical protein VTK73DRAFT_5219 [Phialemonium thermophilum]|uniref:AMP-dependent synthetase/ligase domain-containing protein n=1 Tax=Phialemonium thermophilum TaxID=223376 RepID=A0ABR3V3N0_9PEZI